jgi:type VI secretion system protein ImpJ
MGAPDDVAACVQSALSALRLVHAPQVPVALPLRPNTYYFAIENKGALYEHMLKAKAVSLFVPDVFRDLQVQLISCAANLVLQGGVKSADGTAVLGSSKRVGT